MKKILREAWLDKKTTMLVILLPLGTMLFVSTFMGRVTVASGKGTFFSGFITGIVMCVVIGVFYTLLELVRTKLKGGKKCNQ